jgi:arylsulfatase A-like enzyme
MDKSVGEVMDYLKRKQVDRQTLIIFLSDNGGLGLTPPRGGKAHTHNLPLRSGKGSVYEGGIRVPMIVSWPGVVREGTRSDVPVMVDDLFPTILEAAGIRDKKAAMQADGSSIMPLLKGNAMPVAERSFIWHYPIKWIPGDGPGINYHSAIRKGDWKMVYDMRTGRKELYNLKDDLGEQRDLSGKEPRKLAELSSLLGQRLRAWQSPMPTFRTTGDQVPWPDQTGQPTQPVRR